MPEAVFNEQSTPAYVDQLVGEGKKYNTLEALAKSRIDADNYIEQLKREQAEMREELNKRVSVEDAIQKFQRNTPSQPTEVQTTPAVAPALDEKTLVERIRQVSQSMNEEQRYNANVEAAAARLVELYGDQEKANAMVKAKAAELGVSVKFLQDAAAQSPTGFFKLLDVDKQPTATPGPTHSDVNPRAFGAANPGVKPGTYAYYEEIRKSNPKQYFTPAIQNQLMKDALERGEAFFN